MKPSAPDLVRSTRALAPGLITTMLLALGACASPGSRAHPALGVQPRLDAATQAELARLYDAAGRPVALEAVVERAMTVDVVFVGERHGDPGAHQLQRELLDALLEAASAAGRELVLSMEMFERDVQLVLDEYLAGLIPEAQFLASARPWANYERDYRPLVERMREEGLPVVAANAPRRYVNRVSRVGLDGLNDLMDEALEYLPPLPYPGPSETYRAEWNERMAAVAHHGGHGDTGARAPDEGDDSALQAQALWDAAMAHSIHLALEEGTPLVLHLTGSFHVENRTGTPEALRHYRSGVRDLVVTVRSAQDPGDFEGSTRELDTEALADFILLTPAERADGG